jgi:hypothetical protein
MHVPHVVPQSRTNHVANLPAEGDYLLVPRATLMQLCGHIAAEQQRFPARRLRQALRILQHILGNRLNESV